MIYLEDLREIIERLEQDLKKSNDIRSNLETIDPALASWSSENIAYDVIYHQADYLLLKCLGLELYDWVIWYLYDNRFFLAYDTERDVERDHNVTIDDINYLVTDLESFLYMVEHGLKVSKKPLERHFDSSINSDPAEEKLVGTYPT